MLVALVATAGCGKPAVDDIPARIGQPKIVSTGDARDHFSDKPQLALKIINDKNTFRVGDKVNVLCRLGLEGDAEMPTRVLFRVRNAQRAQVASRDGGTGKLDGTKTYIFESTLSMPSRPGHYLIDAISLDMVTRVETNTTSGSSASRVTESKAIEVTVTP
jgi:hypothetical protein